MKYEDLFNELLSRVPDYAQKLTERTSEMDLDPTEFVHTTFENVIVPFLVEEKNNPNVMQKVFSFFEDMEKTNEIEIIEVLDFSVLEPLVSYHNNDIDIYKKYMGKQTMEDYYKLERFF